MKVILKKLNGMHMEDVYSGLERGSTPNFSGLRPKWHLSAPRNQNDIFLIFPIFHYFRIREYKTKEKWGKISFTNYKNIFISLLQWQIFLRWIFRPTNLELTVAFWALPGTHCPYHLRLCTTSTWKPTVGILEPDMIGPEGFLWRAPKIYYWRLREFRCRYFPETRCGWLKWSLVDDNCLLSKIAWGLHKLKWELPT